MYTVRLAAVLILMPACVGWAQGAEGREKLWGTWQTGSESWVLSRADSGKVHVSQSENGTKQIDFNCDTVGTECKTKVAGKDATFSMYFNGDTLVQWERAGKETIRRRFKVADDGSLQIESQAMSPPGKPETVKLARSGAPAGAPAGTQEAERARQDSQGQIDRK
jgi:hypothetical protein